MCDCSSCYSCLKVDFDKSVELIAANNLDWQEVVAEMWTEDNELPKLLLETVEWMIRNQR